MRKHAHISYSCGSVELEQIYMIMWMNVLVLISPVYHPFLCFLENTQQSKQWKPMHYTVNLFFIPAVGFLLQSILVSVTRLLQIPFPAEQFVGTPSGDGEWAPRAMRKALIYLFESHNLIWDVGINASCKIVKRSPNICWYLEVFQNLF